MANLVFLRQGVVLGRGVQDSKLTMYQNAKHADRDCKEYYTQKHTAAEPHFVFYKDMMAILFWYLFLLTSV